jgi:tRNA modification GTPase
LREGATVVLVGRPNVGKSSLFNRLLEDERALVSPAPGTTRDYLEAWLDIEGIPVRLIDTAGLRQGGAELEAEGVRRAEAREREADLRLVVCEAPAGITAEDADVLARTAGRTRLVLWNKSDRFGEGGARGAVGARGDDVRADDLGSPLWVSARTGSGLDVVRREIAQALVDGVGREPADEVLPGERHEDAIRRAAQSLELADATWREGGTEELVAGDVRDAAEALGEITGRTAGDEVLERIFSRFCVGK